MLEEDPGPPAGSGSLPIAGVKSNKTFFIRRLSRSTETQSLTPEGQQQQEETLSGTRLGWEGGGHDRSVTTPPPFLIPCSFIVRWGHNVTDLV